MLASYRHPPEADAATCELAGRIVEIAHVRRRFGYRRIHDLLRPEFPGVNHKRVWRLYSAANLAVRKRRKVRRPPAERVPLRARALARIGQRDPHDGQVSVCALLLDCPFWTEDRNFFGTGFATWTTALVELYFADPEAAVVRPDSGHGV